MHGVLDIIPHSSGSSLQRDYDNLPAQQQPESECTRPAEIQTGKEVMCLRWESPLAPDSWLPGTMNTITPRHCAECRTNMAAPLVDHADAWRKYLSHARIFLARQAFPGLTGSESESRSGTRHVIKGVPRCSSRPPRIVEGGHIFTL